MTLGTYALLVVTVLGFVAAGVPLLAPKLNVRGRSEVASLFR
jgi:hypothetical protein